MSDDLRHLPGCPENPLVESYVANRRHVTRCVSCGDQVVSGPAPAEVAAVFDPERNPNHPAAGMTMRQATYERLAERLYRPAVRTHDELVRLTGRAND